MKTLVKLISIFITLETLCHAYQIGFESSSLPHFLEPGNSVTIEGQSPSLRIFCHNAKSKYLIHIWRTVYMNLEINLENYEIYDGRTPNEITTKYEDNRRSWNFNFFSTKKNKQFRINPFEDACIGVNTLHHSPYEYKMSMSEQRVDVWKIAYMILGILIFWSGKRLSQNTLFYYLCGITLGVTTSVIILIYFVGKLFPKGKFMYLMVATGYTMSFYVAQLLWDNAQLIALQYRDFVLWYVLITSLISFVICYRFGPITNTRTKRIIQWFLQSLGLVMIYCSSYFYEASGSCCVLVLMLYNFPIFALKKGRKYCSSFSFWRKSSNSRRLLTEDEYHKEGLKETRKALQDLQDYCSSPECSPWKTVLKLKDPLRFAKFVERGTHVTEDESFDYDTSIAKLIEECEYTDDEDDEL